MTSITASSTTTTSVVVLEALSKAASAVSSSLSIDSPQVSQFLKPYPSTPALWLTYHVDNVCGLLRFCQNWRQQLGISESSPLFATVPSLASGLPPLLTFAEHVQQQRGVVGNESTSSESLMSSLMDYAHMAYTYAFRTSSTALGDLSTPEAITALIGLVFMLRAMKKHWWLPVFQKWGESISTQTHGPKWVKRNPDRIAKFAEYNFRLLYHATISILGTYWFVMQEKWWDFSSMDSWSIQSQATLHLFQNFPYHAVSPRMTWYYLIQAAYNLDALVSLLELSLEYGPTEPNGGGGGGRRRRALRWSPNVRGDFNEMFVHHVVTNLLIIGSSKCRLTRIGSVVFWIHDVSDVPIDISKLAHFVRWKVTTVVCFCVMVAAWCWTRLYLLPFVVYRAVLNQSVNVCEGWDDFVESDNQGAADGTATKSGVSPLLYMVYRHAFYVLIAFLILLHTVWFGMFLQIFYSIIFKRKVEDLSEHKAGEDVDDDDADSDDTDDDNDEANVVAAKGKHDAVNGDGHEEEKKTD